MSRLQRSCALALLILSGAIAPLAHAQPPAAITPPKHLFVAPCLRPVVETMLEHSPTFRAQVDAIARTRALGIAIVLAAGSGSRRADATMRRYASGLLLATIRIHSLADKEELIAHELEHVLEQVEHVPLATMAKVGQEAWRTGDAFETRRAIEAGRRVASELRASATLSARARP